MNDLLLKKLYKKGKGKKKNEHLKMYDGTFLS
jgi:hypothetical protein